MIDRELEATLRRIEIRRLFLPDRAEPGPGETAGLAERFLDAFAAGRDLRHLNVAIKLIDRLEAIGGPAQQVEALRAREGAFLAELAKQWGGA